MSKNENLKNNILKKMRKEYPNGYTVDEMMEYSRKYFPTYEIPKALLVTCSDANYEKIDKMVIYNLDETVEKVLNNEINVLESFDYYERKIIIERIRKIMLKRKKVQSLEDQKIDISIIRFFKDNRINFSTFENMFIAIKEHFPKYNINQIGIFEVCYDFSDSSPLEIKNFLKSIR